MEITLRPWHIDDADELATLRQTIVISLTLWQMFFPIHIQLKTREQVLALANNSSNPSLPLSGLPLLWTTN